MLYYPLLIVVMIITAGVGLCLGYIGQRVATQRQRRASEERVRQVLQEAEREAESKMREALLEDHRFPLRTARTTPCPIAP